MSELSELRRLLYKTISNKNSFSTVDAVKTIQIAEFGKAIGETTVRFNTTINIDVVLEHITESTDEPRYSLSLELNERNQYLIKFIRFERGTPINIAANPTLEFFSRVVNDVVQVYISIKDEVKTDGEILITPFIFTNIEVSTEIKDGYLSNPAPIKVITKAIGEWTEVPFDAADPEAIVFESLRLNDNLNIKGNLTVVGAVNISENLNFGAVTYNNIIINTSNEQIPLTINVYNSGTQVYDNILDVSLNGNINTTGDIVLSESKSLLFTKNNFTTRLSITNPTANQVYSLPNKIDGSYTLATITDINNTNVTLTQGNGVSITGGSFTLNKSTDTTVTIAHGPTSNIGAGLKAGNGVSSITVDEFGHITAVDTETYLTSLTQSNDFGKITIGSDSGFTWSGTGSADAEAKADELKLISGTGISLNVDSGNDAVRIAIGTVPAANGGTGLTLYASGDILYASGTTALSKLSIPFGVTSGRILGLADGLPVWIDPNAGGTGLVTTSTEETLSNKSFIDANTYFIDEFDSTRRMNFQLAGVTTNQTRVLTIPDYNGVISTLDGTEILSNKSLQSVSTIFIETPIEGTKGLKFNLSAITGGQTRTLSVPNYDGIISTVQGNENLTNKTLELFAGSSAVAPLKFTSGTNLATPQAGVIEYNGTTFFATPGATRNSIPTVVPNPSTSVLDTVRMVVVTQAQYNAIGTKDANTLYFVLES
jgi:hypothetical protein